MPDSQVVEMLCAIRGDIGQIKADIIEIKEHLAVLECGQGYLGHRLNRIGADVEQVKALLDERAPVADQTELERLRSDCREFYQVIGGLADKAGLNDDDAYVIKALDNALAAANGEPRPHDDLLPFTPGE